MSRTNEAAWGIALTGIAGLLLATTRPAHASGETLQDSAEGTQREADAFPYGEPPYVLNVSSTYAFFSLSSTGVDTPPDFMPDPDLIWQAGAGAYLYITRFSSSPWGPWDQVILARAGYKLKGTNQTFARYTQGFSSVEAPTLASYPYFHHKLAAFHWRKSNQGSLSLTLVSPPNSTNVVAEFGELWGGVPAIPYPSASNVVPENYLQSKVSDGTVTGHYILKTHLDILLNVAYVRTMTAVKSELDVTNNNFIHVGTTGSGKFSLSTVPYP